MRLQRLRRPVLGDGSNGSLVTTASGKCLDVTDWSTTDGSQLRMWTCGGTANQSWTLA
ncbi:RICIN domain-containing protein [Streptomyces sp. NPDC096323]|uniref:RICIN domain-containing protein n=1 Tax=Streptomyces sp. NPDC096323 TaxID=3155822 RepID=UPI00331DF138